MKSEVTSRKIGPDLLKIIATVFVIVIHHKSFRADPVYVKQFNFLCTVLFLFSVIIGVFLMYRSARKNQSRQKSLIWFIVPLGCFVAFILLRRFAVTFFLLISGYLLAKSFNKHNYPLKAWYTPKNLISRIMRFYLPLLPVFVVGLLYKIFVMKYNYSVIEVVARVVLGGFKPGSYYITILAELVLIFPVIFLVVKRYKLFGLAIIFVLNLIYDVGCAFLGMNSILYKFLIFRFITHIALGIYAGLTDFNTNKKFNIAMIIGGVICHIIYLCIFYGNTKLFFQWNDASLLVAVFMYIPVMWFIDITKNLKYTDTPLSRFTMTFANSTYHIFLIQLLYYTTIGYALNARIYNVAITIPLNLILTIPAGIWYYKRCNPIENKIIAKITQQNAKNP